METKKDTKGVNQLTISYIIAYVITVMFSSLLTIAKDLHAPLKDWMKSLTTHHWVTHGIFVIVLFFFLAFIFDKQKTGKKMTADQLSNWVIYGTILSGIILVGFYVFEVFLKAH
jgi:hypothetical protein